MTIYQRPDERVLAESAKDGEIKDFPDIKRGWGVTFEQTGGIPPMEWFNALGKRTDQAIRYLMQRGITEWSSSEEYPAGALVQHNGQLWVAEKNHHGIEPKINTIWQATALTVEQVKALIPVNSVNGKMGDVQLTPNDIGALTKVEADQYYLTHKDLLAEMPVGMPQIWPTATPPSGCLKCNGSSFDKNRYPLLAKAYPDGVLPDLRGEFVRGWDDGRGIDVGRNINSLQTDAIRNIWGQIGARYELAGLCFFGNGEGALRGVTDVIPDKVVIKAHAIGHSSVNLVDRNNFAVFDASKFVPTAEENRPRNIAFLYIVRAA